MHANEIHVAISIQIERLIDHLFLRRARTQAFYLHLMLGGLPARPPAFLRAMQTGK